MILTITSEVRQGVYETPAGFSATVGTSYSLLITTSEGLEYTSFPSKALRPPVLDSLSYQTITTIPSKDRLNPRSGIQLTAHFRDPSDQKNYIFPFLKTKKTSTYPSTVPRP